MSEKDDKAVVYSVKKGFLKKRIKNSNQGPVRRSNNYPKLVIYITVLLLMVVVVSLIVRNQQKDSEYQKSIEGLTKIKDTSSVTDVVNNYAGNQDQNKQELEKSKSNEWDKEKLDKVYFNLIYADKIGSFNEVYAMLAFIDVAEKSGIDIDDNSYGINEQSRNDIKLRADKALESRNSKVRQ